MTAIISFIIGVFGGVFLSALSVASHDIGTAEWILQTDAFKPHYGYFKCSRCDAFSEKQSVYCPKCGSFMMK